MPINVDVCRYMGHGLVIHHVVFVTIVFFLLCTICYAH